MQKLSVFWSLAMVLSNGCSGTRVVSFINDDMNLRNYQSYKLVGVNMDENNYSVNGLVFFSQIEKNIIDEMDKRTFSPSEKPDLIVRYEIVSSQRTETSNSYNYYDPYAYYRPAYTISRQITEGVLLIEFRDRKQKQLVWQASIDFDYKRQEPTDMVSSSIKKIFETFPYLAGSYEVIPSLQRNNRKRH